MTNYFKLGIDCNIDDDHFQIKVVCLGRRGLRVLTGSLLRYQYTSFTLSFPFKGSVSRQVRHRLLYIIRKLFSRPIIAGHKILILLKGQFAMYIKQFRVS